MKLSKTTFLLYLSLLLQPFILHSQENSSSFGGYSTLLNNIVVRNNFFRFNSASNIIQRFNFHSSPSTFRTQYGNNASKINFIAEKMKMQSNNTNEIKGIHFNEVNNSNANLISGRFSFAFDTKNTLESSSFFLSIAPMNSFTESGMLIDTVFSSPQNIVKGIVFEFKTDQINIFWDKKKIKEFKNVSYANALMNRLHFEINYSDNRAKITLGINDKFFDQVILSNITPYRNRISLVSKGKSSLEVDGIRISYIEYTNIKRPIVLSRFSSKEDTNNSLELKPYSSNLFDTTLVNLEFNKETNSQLSLSIIPQDPINNQSNLTFTFLPNDILNIYWKNKLIDSVTLPVSFTDRERKILKILFTQIPEGHQLSLYTNKGTAIKEIFIKGFYPFPYKTIINGTANKSTNINNGKIAIQLQKIEFFNFNQTIDKLFVLNQMYFTDKKNDISFSPKNMKVFQGLINKKIPKIFFIENKEDIFWLEKLDQYYGIKALEIKSVKDLYLSVINRVKEIGKFIVYKNYENVTPINSVATYAGQVEAFIISQPEYLKIQSFLEQDLKLKKIADWASENKFMNNTIEDIQKWMYQNLIQKSNPITFFMAPLTLEYKGFDYAVANNLFWMILDSRGLTLRDYATTQTSILKYFPPTGALGNWTSEVSDVEALSKYGHTRLALSNNTSVYSFLPRPKKFTQQVNLKGQKENKPIDINAKYIFLSFSQGDSLQFCLNDNLQTLIMNSCIDPNKTIGQLYNFGMMCTTLAYYFNPTSLQYFYNSQDNILLTAKGYGYNNPSTFISSGFQDLFVKKSKYLMNQSGILDFMLNDSTISNSADDQVDNRAVAEIITKQIKPRSILFKHVFDKNLPTGTSENIILNNVPIFLDPIIVHPDDQLLKTTQGKSPCVQATYFDFSNDVNMIISSSKKRQFQWVFLDHQMSSNPELFEKLYIQLSEKIKNDKLNIKLVNGVDFFKAFAKIKMNQN